MIMQAMIITVIDDDHSDVMMTEYGVSSRSIADICNTGGV